MTLFDVAVQIVRADAAMLRAGISVEQRGPVLDHLAKSLVREGLKETEVPQKVVPFRRPL